MLEKIYCFILVNILHVAGIVAMMLLFVVGVVMIVTASETLLYTDTCVGIFMMILSIMGMKLMIDSVKESVDDL